MLASLLTATLVSSLRPPAEQAVVGGTGRDLATGLLNPRIAVLYVGRLPALAPDLLGRAEGMLLLVAVHASMSIRWLATEHGAGQTRTAQGSQLRANSSRTAGPAVDWPDSADRWPISDHGPALAPFRGGGGRPPGPYDGGS